MDLGGKLPQSSLDPPESTRLRCVALVSSRVCPPERGRVGRLSLITPPTWPACWHVAAHPLDSFALVRCNTACLSYVHSGQPGGETV